MTFLLYLLTISLQVATWYSTNSAQLQKKTMAPKRELSVAEPVKAVSSPPKKVDIKKVDIKTKREGVLPQKTDAPDVEIFTLDDSGDEDEDFLNRTENLLEDSMVVEEMKENIELQEKVKVIGGGSRIGKLHDERELANFMTKEVKALKEKLAEAEKARDKYKKDMEVKADDLKSLQDRIPKMIEECTKYVEERDATNKVLEEDVAKKNAEVALKVAELEKLQKETLEGKSKIESLTTTKSANEKLKQILASRDELLKNKEEALKKANKEIEHVKAGVLKREGEVKTKEAKEKKAMVEMKEKLQMELKRISTESVKKVKVLEKREKELVANNKGKAEELEKVKAALDSNEKTSKADLAKSKEEILEKQVKIEKLTKMNTNCKQQFEQMSKLCKTLQAKSTKDSTEKDSRINSLLAEISDLKGNLANKDALGEKEKKEREAEMLLKDAKLKEMTAEGVAQKEKTDKLLEVLGKRGVQVRDLKKIIEAKAQKEKEKEKQAEEKEANNKMILKQKDGQIVELIKKSNAKIQKKDEEVKRRLSEKEVALQNVQKENDEAKTVIQQFRQRLVAFDSQIQENIKTSKDQLVAKEKEIEGLKVAHTKDRRKLVLDCSEKLDSMEQKLRAKALEHGQKLLEKEQKMKENLAKAAARAEAARRQLEQRDVKLEEVAEEMKRKEVVEINKMNNLRNSLLAKEQASKQMEISFAAFSSRQVALEARQAKLESRLEQRRQLIVKLKGVALYKEPEDITQNKEVSKLQKLQQNSNIFHQIGQNFGN